MSAPPGADATPSACRDEAELYRALDLDYIPPEMREDTGEIEAAEKGEVPVLVEVGDVTGIFHCHTTESDGADTLEDMAKAARALGLKYLGLADHSQSLTVANGLSPERVRRQQEAIDALNKHYKGFRLFKGTECDILADGRLDFDDALLATFDYVVASVHSHFQQSREEMTARIVRAVRHSAVTMLGHATGRLLLRREGYPVDLEAVLQACAESGVMVEINAHPARLDLDWVHCKRARALGVPLVINPDAHSTADLGLYRFGVDVARRGWLTKADVFNTRPLSAIVAALAAQGPTLREVTAGRYPLRSSGFCPSPLLNPEHEPTRADPAESLPAADPPHRSTSPTRTWPPSSTASPRSGTPPPSAAPLGRRASPRPTTTKQPHPNCVYATPDHPPLLLPDDWNARVQAAGAVAFKAHNGRDATLGNLKDALRAPAPNGWRRRPAPRPRSRPRGAVPRHRLRPRHDGSAVRGDVA